MRKKSLIRRSIFLFPLFFFLVTCQPQTLKVTKSPVDRHQPYDYVGKKGMVVAAHPEAGIGAFLRPPK